MVNKIQYFFFFIYSVSTIHCFFDYILGYELNYDDTGFTYALNFNLQKKIEFEKQIFFLFIMYR